MISAANCAPDAAATIKWRPTFGCSCATQQPQIANATLDLIEAINIQAGDHIDTPSPGFTHLQHAQPLSFGHELAKHSHALLRDVDRLADWDRRTARSPLGAGALAGSSLQLDPQQVAAGTRLRCCPRQFRRCGE